MKIENNTNLEEIRAQMGTEATTDGARRMLSALLAANIKDTDALTDADWLEMTREAQARAALESALPAVRAMEWVQSACVWCPDEDEKADLRADGIKPQAQLEVTVWRAHKNPTDIRIDIEALGLECVGSGSAIEGPCYSFIAK